MSAFLFACLFASVTVSPSPDAFGGIRSTVVSVPDLDGDGRPEVAVADWEPANRAKVRFCRGSDGKILWAHNLEERFLAMTHVSRPDRVSRLVVASHPAELKALDLSTGQVEWKLQIEFAQHEQITNLETLPDFDGDGFEELLVAVAGRYPGEETCLRLFSGSSGAELKSWRSLEIEGRRCQLTSAFGVRWVKDGVRTGEIAIAVTYPGTKDESLTHALALFDLKTGEARQLCKSPDPSWLILDVADFDGDGVRDLAVTHEAWWLYILSGVDGKKLERRGFGGGQLWNRASSLAVLRGSCESGQSQVVYDGSHIGFLKNEHGKTIEAGECERTLWWAYLEEVIDLHLGEDDQECVDLATYRDPKDPRLDAVLVHLQLQRRVLLVEGRTGRILWDQSLRDE